jgi:hypothetical protein
MEKTSCTDHEKSKEILHTVQEDKNILHTIKWKKGDRIGQILSKNFLPKHVVQGKIKSTGILGRRHRQLLHDLKGTQKY